MFKQRTIKQAVKISGIGVHSGRKINLVLRPAPVNAGVIFTRVDLNPVVSIKANAFAVGETMLSSCLVKDNIRISTVEHLMAALSGLGIDNICVDVDAPEIPIMDGSAAPFILLLKEAGIFEQYCSKHFFKIKKEIIVEQEDKWAKLLPYDGFRMDFTLKYDHPVFKRLPQKATFDFSKEDFGQELSRARTFGLLSDYDKLRLANLALGGSLDNTVVIDDHKIVNPEGLRYENECAKHKLLDALGDLYMIGGNLIGYFVGYKSGHTLNNLLVRRVLADKDNYEEIILDEERILFPQFILQQSGI